jgi:hypothetical protein
LFNFKNITPTNPSISELSSIIPYFLALFAARIHSRFLSVKTQESLKTLTQGKYLPALPEGF